MHDAIVIGAGPNGLVAANRLVDAGWSVLVLEAQPEVGGAVRSDRAVHPDFVHDTFSAFHPLAATSPHVQAFHLEQHGLRWQHAPAVLGHPLPDGSWALLHRDRHITADLMESAAADAVPLGAGVEPGLPVAGGDDTARVGEWCVAVLEALRTA